MYEKLNDSPETEEEKKIRYVNKRKAHSSKETGDKPAKFKKLIVTDAELQTGHDNTNVQPEERNVRSAENQATSRIAADPTKKTNHIHDEATSSAEEDEWSPNTIHSKNQKTHSTRSLNNNGPEFFTLSALVNNRPIKFIIRITGDTNTEVIYLITKHRCTR